MSTKHPAACPRCQQQTLPTDRMIAVDYHGRTMPLRMWRYDCPACRWVWADAAQRAHNDTIFTRALRAPQGIYA